MKDRCGFVAAPNKNHQRPSEECSQDSARMQRGEYPLLAVGMQCSANGISSHLRLKMKALPPPTLCKLQGSRVRVWKLGRSFPKT